MLAVKPDDIVEILPGYAFPGLVYSRGVVTQSLNSRLAVVEFISNKRSVDVDLPEVLQGTTWIVPEKFIKVLDSPHDNRIGELEEEILGLESDIVTIRSCLTMSEELRDMQEAKIRQLIEEVDILRAELYYLKGN